MKMNFGTQRQPAPNRPLAKLAAKLGLSLALAATALAAPLAWAGWNSTAEPIQANHPTWLYTPSSTMPTGKRALMIVMHGCDQSHTQLKEWGNLDPTADKYGVVMAVPWVGKSPWPMMSSMNCWNYDGAADGSKHIAEMVELTKTLIARADLNIDRRHVYITGLSAGASLALDLACKAPDLIAGVSAIAGPSVGSSQADAIKDAGGITYTPEQAKAKCKALAGSAAKEAYFNTQIANIAYGEKDKNGEKPGCSYSAGNTSCPGTFQLVSKKWSTINAEMFRQIYGAPTLGAPASVTSGPGTGMESSSSMKNKPVLALSSVIGAGHAWPAGSGKANEVAKGGVWMAQSSMNYGQYAIEWFFANNRRGPSLTCYTQLVGDNNVIVGADAAGLTITAWTVAINGPTPLDGPAAGTGNSFSKTYGPLADGSYTAKVTAADSDNNQLICEPAPFQIAPGVVPPPTNLKPGPVGSTSVTLSWTNAQAISTYKVSTYKNDTLLKEGTASAGNGTTTHAVTGLTPETNYTFKVQSLSASGKPSVPVSVDVKTAAAQSSTCKEFTASNQAHVTAGRASSVYGWGVAKGSNWPIGWVSAYVFTTLAEIKPGYFMPGKCLTVPQ